MKKLFLLIFIIIITACSKESLNTDVESNINNITINYEQNIVNNYMIMDIGITNDKKILEIYVKEMNNNYDDISNLNLVLMNKNDEIIEIITSNDLQYEILDHEQALITLYIRNVKNLNYLDIYKVFISM